MVHAVDIEQIRECDTDHDDDDDDTAEHERGDHCQNHHHLSIISYAPSTSPALTTGKLTPNNAEN